MLAALMLSASTARALGVDELEQRLKRTPPVSAPFVEYRFSRLLKRPLRTAGLLEYRADGVLARTVDEPYREHTEVAGDEVRIRRGDRPQRRLSLQRAPQLRLLLGSFRALLEGRFAPLAGDFTMTLEEGGELWTLTLTPRDAGLARALARIHVHGIADRIACLESTEPDGDATLTIFGPDPGGPRPERRALESACRIAAAVPAAH
jgi:hypothetical protein